MLVRQAALLLLLLSAIGGSCYGLSRLMPVAQPGEMAASQAPPGSFARMSPAERAERIAKVFRE